MREYGSLLEESKEDPGTRKRRYIVTIVAFIVVFVGVPWWAYYGYFHIPERRAVTHFFTALTAGDTQTAYNLWKADPAHYAYKDFMEDWGPTGIYGPVKSYRIESLSSPPKGGSGIIVVVEVSAYQPFPDGDDVEKSAKNKEIDMWVETRDKSLSFAPHF